MSMTKQKIKNDCIIFDTLENLVPQDHLVRKIERCMDFTFIEYEVKDLYSSVGRASIPPVVLFKLLLINKIFGINLLYVISLLPIIIFSYYKNGYLVYDSGNMNLFLSLQYLIIPIIIIILSYVFENYYYLCIKKEDYTI